MDIRPLTPADQTEMMRVVDAHPMWKNSSLEPYRVQFQRQIVERFSDPEFCFPYGVVDGDNIRAWALARIWDPRDGIGSGLPILFTDYSVDHPETDHAYTKTTIMLVDYVLKEMDKKDQRIVYTRGHPLTRIDKTSNLIDIPEAGFYRYYRELLEVIPVGSLPQTILMCKYGMSSVSFREERIYKLTRRDDV